MWVSQPPSKGIFQPQAFRRSQQSPDCNWPLNATWETPSKNYTCQVVSGFLTHLVHKHNTCHFFIKYFIFVLLWLSQFFPFTLFHPAHSLLSQSIPTHLSTFMGHTYMFLDWSLSLLSTLIPIPSPPGHCQSAPCFHASASILLVCFIH